MDATQSFQPVLEKLAAPLAKQADTLLDLREAVLSRGAPGRCVTCYFKLLAAEGARKDPPLLTPLRQWLEAHIEIVAQDDDAQELERSPLEIGEGESLDDFVRRLINRYFEDRLCTAERVRLNFAYRGEAMVG